MKAHMQLGNYLVDYLRKIGVCYLLSITGDLVIQLFMKFGQPHKLQVITASHEPGAGSAVWRRHPPSWLRPWRQCA